MQDRIDRSIRRLIGWLATAQEYCYRAQAVPVWTCADGRVMPITEMDDNHLRNAINLIERNAPHALKRSWILPALKAEQAERAARNAWSQARGPDSDTAKPAVADFKCAPDPVAALARRVRDLEFKLQRRASHDALELMRTAIDKRLCALEMWTHKPVPVVTVDELRKGLVAAMRDSRWLSQEHRAVYSAFSRMAGAMGLT